MLDRASLLIRYAGGPRRSEIASLDVQRHDTRDSGRLIEIPENGALLTLNAKTGWREVETGRNSSEWSFPVHALEQWLHFARVVFGPLFTRETRDGTTALPGRLNDRHVARLIKRTALDAGLLPDPPETAMLRRYQRRCHRFRLNLTRALGL